MQVSRRRALQGAGLIGLAALAPPGLLAACGTPAHRLRTFTPHQAAVLDAATARLIPGPLDDPAEAGHPGAREAHVTHYLDVLLSPDALEVVFGGGPFSDRAGGDTDDFSRFIPLTAAQRAGWTRRLASWRGAYARGVAALDAAAGGDFVHASAATQDAVLAGDPGGFVSLLFGHALEGMYAAPEYGGNFGLRGWSDIRFAGDVQPRGYTAAEVSSSDGPDRYVPAGAGAKIIDVFKASSGA